MEANGGNLEKRNNVSILLNCRAKKMYEIVNKQIKILTSQYIGTCKSAYTKGVCPKLSTSTRIVKIWIRKYY